ncbi:RDD family protein [Almyronema epifaneia]|uniref:RDD family protein n=1 Tax=Almyronema epifaneia S1 TaxID=2991925 RepID=A0ABW6ICH8_9CYAN
MSALTRYPKVPIWRRAAALAVDCLPAGGFSILAANHLGFWLMVFVPVWLGLRVAVGLNRQGQSLGRWAFNLRVAKLHQGKMPLLPDLLKREAVVGLECALAVFGMMQLGPMAAWAVILLLPLLGDCALALADPVNKQTFHDRIAGTVVIPSRRGYDLDLRLKKWFAIIRQSVKK